MIYYKRPLARLFVLKPICAVLVLLASAGCVPVIREAGSDRPDSAIEGTSAGIGLLRLEGTPWVLVSFVGPDGPLTIPETLTPTLKFENGAYKFDAGCNPVFGDYNIRDGTPKITTVIMRSVNCGGDLNGVEAMALENALADSIVTWSTYRIADDGLHIEFEGGEMRFQSASAFSKPTPLP